MLEAVASASDSDSSVLSGPEGLSVAPVFFKERPNPFLEQGDLISKESDVVQGPLAQYHRYHVENLANEMFAVLTQSCDLVYHGNICKARYISLAPVRSLRAILTREFEKDLVQTPGNLYAIGSTATEARYNDFLRKIINNNDSRHFFIPKKPELGVPEDLCIMLPLALPIKAEHYKACVQGRIAQLDDLFQAKLGWLLGQQYSRVGTPDWPDDLLNEKATALNDQVLSWFPDNDFSQIKRLVQEFSAKHPGQTIDEPELTALMKQVKNRREMAIDTVFSLLEEYIPPPGQQRFALRKKLRQDSNFAKYFPAS